MNAESFWTVCEHRALILEVVLENRRWQAPVSTDQLGFTLCVSSALGAINPETLRRELETGADPVNCVTLSELLNLHQPWFFH